MIGYGGQGAWHCKQIEHSDVVELSSVYDVKPERNEIAGKNGHHVYETVESAIEDPEVNIVVIAVPNDDHKDLVIRGLEAGKM